MKTLFLLAPSEWKKTSPPTPIIIGEGSLDDLSFNFEKPLDIALNATEKDLKCKWDRFIEWIELNKKITSPQPSPEGEGAYLEAINRYSGVVFNAIDYSWMNKNWKYFFEENVLILSGMYWLLKPLDKILNYKLPIETKWLYKFWWEKITYTLNEINPDYIVNLLPLSYLKMINPKLIKSKIININFYNTEWKKFSHWVKKYRGEFLKNVCENNLINYEQFGWEVVKSWNVVDVNIVV